MTMIVLVHVNLYPFFCGLIYTLLLSYMWDRSRNPSTSTVHYPFSCSHPFIFLLLPSFSYSPRQIKKGEKKAILDEQDSMSISLLYTDEKV